MPETRAAAGYIRVSSEEQAQHGISCDAQRSILEAWATMTQAGPIRIYEDPGYSGKNTARPALQRLLADVRAGAVSVVVVYKLDRLSRSLRDTLTIIEDDLQPRGVSLVSTTESIDTATPAGRMMLNMLASFAQLEREQDSDRVVMAHKHLAHDCRYLGGHVALGYRVGEDRRFELDPATAPIVRRVFDMYLSRAGYTEILGYLNGAAAQFFKRSTPWKKTDLNYLLKNEIYAGVYTRKIGADKRSKVTAPEVIRVPGGVPAILSPEEWQRVARMREENRSAKALYTARTIYPLSGLVRCGVCGGLMPLEHGGKARDGSVERYYTCRKHCVKPARLEALEAAVWASLDALGEHEADLRRCCEIANSYSAAAQADRAADAAPIRAELARNRREISKITDFIRVQGAQTSPTLAEELRRLEASCAVLESRLEASVRPISTYDPARTLSALRACRNIKKRPPEEQKPLLQEALRAIQITDDDYRLILAWHTYGGDDPPAYVCHPHPRKKGTGAPSPAPFHVRKPT